MDSKNDKTKRNSTRYESLDACTRHRYGSTWINMTKSIKCSKNINKKIEVGYMAAGPMQT